MEGTIGGGASGDRRCGAGKRRSDLRPAKVQANGDGGLRPAEVRARGERRAEVGRAAVGVCDQCGRGAIGGGWGL